MANYEYVRTNRRLATRHRNTDVDSIKWHFCFGDSASINSYLRNRNGWAWVLPKFLNALLRGFSQVVFANNPFSGIIILTGLIWYNLTFGLLVLSCAALAVITAVIVNLHPKNIIAGLVTFNSILFSSVTSSMWTRVFDEPLSSMPLNVCVFIIIGSILSVLISNSLTNLLSSLKPNVPILAIPFHILIFVTFACLRPDTNVNLMNQDETFLLNNHLNGSQTLTLEDDVYHRLVNVPIIENLSVAYNWTANDEIISWGTLQNVALGITLSSGQVLGVVDLVFSLLVYTAVLVYSPVLTFMCLYGATIGTVMGLFLTPFPNQEVVLGAWGFNGFLSGGAIGIFYIFNFYSFLNGTASVVFTSVLQLCLSSAFAESNMPCFGLPFILSTVLFVSVTSNGDQLVRVKTVTFPEQSRSSYYASKRRNQEELMTERV